MMIKKSTKSQPNRMVHNINSSSGHRDQHHHHHEASFAQIRADLVGRLQTIETPFGNKPLVCKFVSHTPFLHKIKQPVLANDVVPSKETTKQT